MAQKLIDPPKVELRLTLSINGRPFWSVAQETKPEATAAMDATYYHEALKAARVELSKQYVAFKAREAQRKKDEDEARKKAEANTTTQPEAGSPKTAGDGN